MLMVRDIIERTAGEMGVDPVDVDFEQVLARLADDEVEQLWAMIEAEEDAERFGKFDRLFPDDGPFRRELYPKHTSFFRAGKLYRERLFMAGNRVGKTVAGGYECSAHLTGRYPHWWEGKRFHRRGKWWVAGDTNETTRDVIQLELLGEIGYRAHRKIVDGSGIIPRECIGDPIWKQGVQNLVDAIPIRHTSGEWSLLGFKSFDQGRRAFQGTAKHGVWLDEEVPEDVWGECRIRTATTRGLMIGTFTPLLGMTPLVKSFLPSVRKYDPRAAT